MSDTGRYQRQQQFAPFGESGQKQLQKARVLIVGVGALGTVAAELLARAGVGFLRLVDRDTVQWNNLQRQSLFDEQDARNQAAKAEAAAKRLRQINSDVTIDPIVADFSAVSAAECSRDIQLIIDATDNFLTRLLINDVSLRYGLPWVHGGCVGAGGQVALFSGKGGPCFRCLVPDVPPPGSVPTCDTAGVLNAATHTIASVQVSEALKWFAAPETSYQGNAMLLVDLWRGRFQSRDIRQHANPNCTACKAKRFDYLDAVVRDTAVTLCGRNAVQLSPPELSKPNLQRIAESWSGLGEVGRTAFFVRLSIEDKQVNLFHDGRAVITGTSDLDEARAIYARFVGT